MHRDGLPQFSGQPKNQLHFEPTQPIERSTELVLGIDPVRLQGTSCFWVSRFAAELLDAEVFCFRCFRSRSKFHAPNFDLYLKLLGFSLSSRSWNPPNRIYSRTFENLLRTGLCVLCLLFTYTCIHNFLLDNVFLKRPIRRTDHEKSG